MDSIVLKGQGGNLGTVEGSKLLGHPSEDHGGWGFRAKEGQPSWMIQLNQGTDITGRGVGAR